MYTLQKDNVVKIVDSEVKRDALKSKGFKLLEEMQTAKEPKDLADMTAKELTAYATEKGISVLPGMKKDEIYKMIADAQAAKTPEESPEENTEG